MIILIIILAACLLFLLWMLLQVLFLDDFINFSKGRKNATNVSFSAFITWYELNPESWVCHSDECYKKAKNTEKMLIFFKTYFDYLMYKHWLKKKAKIEAKKEINKRDSLLIHEVTKDLDVYKKKSGL